MSISASRYGAKICEEEGVEEDGVEEDGVEEDDVAVGAFVAGSAPSKHA
jgi:hypothetical protein